jgi:hypothetical protein
MLTCKGHDRTVDQWALGCLIYEVRDTSQHAIDSNIIDPPPPAET